MSNQDEEKQELTQEQVERAVGKLQAFYDSLPEDEKMVLEAVLSMATGAEVTGHAIPYPQPVYEIETISLASSKLNILRPSSGAWYVENSAHSSPDQGPADQGGGGGGAAGGGYWIGNQFRGGA